MSKWLDAMGADPSNLGVVFDAYEHFEKEYDYLRSEIQEEKLRGRRLIEVAGKIAGLSEYVHAQWVHIRAVIALLELRLASVTQNARRYYTESYARALGAHQIEHYAKADPEVVAHTELLIRLGLLRDKLEGVSKGVERLHYQIGHIKEMRVAGIEDATL